VARHIRSPTLFLRSFKRSPTSTTNSLNFMPRPQAIGPIAQRLALEEFLLIFAAFTLPELLSMSLVCRTWRAAARAHPTYWRSVNLTGLHSDAVSLLLNRLAYSSTAPLSLVLRRPKGHGCPSLEKRDAKRVIDALGDNMRRVVDLKFCASLFPDDCSTALVRALCYDAPRIESLYIDASGWPSLNLRQNVLGGSAPKLQVVTMLGVQWPSTRVVPTAFINATQLRITTNKPATATPAILSGCKSLQRLTISSSSNELPTFPPPITFPASATMALRHLRLDPIASNVLVTLNAWHAVAHIDTVCISTLSHNEDANSAFFGSLKGKLHIHSDERGWDNRRRTMRISMNEVEGSEEGADRKMRIVERVIMPDAFRRSMSLGAGIVSRITTACVAIGLLPQVAAFCSNVAPALRQLNLLLDARTDDMVLTTWSCPKLKTLVFVGGDKDAPREPRKKTIHPLDVEHFAMVLDQDEDWDIKDHVRYRGVKLDARMEPRYYDRAMLYDTDDSDDDMSLFGDDVSDVEIADVLESMLAGSAGTAGVFAALTLLTDALVNGEFIQHELLQHDLTESYSSRRFPTSLRLSIPCHAPPHSLHHTLMLAAYRPSSIESHSTIWSLAYSFTYNIALRFCNIPHPGVTLLLSFAAQSNPINSTFFLVPCVSSSRYSNQAQLSLQACGRCYTSTSIVTDRTTSGIPALFKPRTSGLRTTALRVHTSTVSSGANSNLFTICARKTLISPMAKRCPMQARGPPRKVMMCGKMEGRAADGAGRSSVVAVDEGDVARGGRSQRDGSNSSASGPHISGEVLIREMGTLTMSPFWTLHRRMV